MKARWIRAGILLPMIFLIPFAIGLAGCASTPRSDRPDYEKIQQDSDKGMQDLKKEEDRQRESDY